MNTRTFSRKLKYVLAHNKIDKRRDREKEGIVDSKRLALYKSTPRVFRKRSEEKIEKEYYISLLLDASGSMREVASTECKHDHLINLLRVLIPVLEHIPGIKYEVATFSETDLILKSFDQPCDLDDILRTYHEVVSVGGDSVEVQWYQNKITGDITDLVEGAQPKDWGIENILIKATGWGGENQDALAVYRAYQRLSEQKGGKILLTFSDGAPTSHFLAHYSKVPVNEMRLRGSKYQARLVNMEGDLALTNVMRLVNKSDVVTLGVGIDSRQVRHYYQHCAFVDDGKDFEKQVVTLLGKIIKKV